MSKLSHIDDEGNAIMVDVGAKEVTRREAVARARLVMEPGTLARIVAGDLPKGDVLAVARTAGILAAKRTPELIPLCHPLPIERVEISLTPDGDSALTITASVAVTAKTGAEMEALTAASVAALTVYDMCKAVDRAMTIEEVAPLEKTGGKSGPYRRR